jgi:hypothetical protein
MRIITAVITARRPKPTLSATIESLSRAGWQAPVVYFDAASDGCYVNWRRAACNALARWHDWGQPTNTWGAIFEDDIDIASSALAHFYSIAYRRCVVSLYTAAHNHVDGAGWHEITSLPRMASGALAILMPLELIRTFMESPPHPEWRDRTDHAIGLFCRATDISWMTHSPSLVRHTAVEHSNSALRDPGGTVAGRQCKEFIEAENGETTFR